MDLQRNPPKHQQSAANDVESVECRRLSPYVNFILVESHPFCLTLDLQLSFYRLLCYNSRPHYLLLQFLRTSAIEAGAHSYFVVSSLKKKK